MIDTKADLTKVQRDAWETPAMVRLDAADAEGPVGGATGDGNSMSGMSAS